MWPYVVYGLQHIRLPCPLVSPEVFSNSCPLSQWCNLTISSSTTLFTFCFQSFPASGSFLKSQLFPSGGQSTGALASASVLPMNIQGGFRLGLIGSILESMRISSVFSSTTIQKHQFFGAQLSLWSNSHILTWLLEKTLALTIWTFVSKILSLLFNMLSRFIIAFLARSKHLLISWLQSPSAVSLEPKKIVFYCFHCFLIYLPWSDGTGCHDLSFLNVKF